MELMWLVHHLGAEQELRGGLASLESVRRRFGPRIAAFWKDSVPRSATELVVLAERSSTLLDVEPGRLFGRIDAAARGRHPVPSLRSEPDEERTALRRRLDRLAAEPELQKAYIALLRDVWSAVTGSWEKEGRSEVAAESAAWSRALAEGAPFRELLGLTQLWPGRPEIDAMADEAAAAGKLMLSPCWFGGKVHVVELDGVVYAGRGLREGEPPYRKVAAQISASIKALADPTRLAILLRLARHPASVTELARQFELSQPTISAHVQVLREAGLLDVRPVGRSAQLSASEEGLRRLFANAEQSLIKLFRS